MSELRGSEPDGSAIRFVTRGLDTTEIAAVTAVVTAAIAARPASASEQGAHPEASGWERARRNLRRPLVRPWRNFQG